MASTFSLRFTSFVDKLLSKKPGDRPTALEAIKMIPSFIKNAYTDKFKKPDKDGSLKPKHFEEVKEPEPAVIEYDSPIITKHPEDKFVNPE